MKVHNDHLWRWTTNPNHFRDKPPIPDVKVSSPYKSFQYKIILVLVAVLCSVCQIQVIESLEFKTESPVGNGFIKGFLRLNTSTSKPGRSPAKISGGLLLRYQLRAQLKLQNEFYCTIVWVCQIQYNIVDVF